MSESIFLKYFFYSQLNNLYYKKNISYFLFLLIDFKEL